MKIKLNIKMNFIYIFNLFLSQYKTLKLQFIKSILYQVVALSKLRSLCSLDVSRTSFNQLGLEIVANDLPLIAHLNISDTKVIHSHNSRKHHISTQPMHEQYYCTYLFIELYN